MSGGDTAPSIPDILSAGLGLPVATVALALGSVALVGGLAFLLFAAPFLPQRIVPADPARAIAGPTAPKRIRKSTRSGMAPACASMPLSPSIELPSSARTMRTTVSARSL